MFALVQNILLAIAWAALTGDFSIANLILGMVLGAVLLWVGRQVTGRTRYFDPNERLPPVGIIIKKTGKVLGFIGFFLWEVVIANIDVMLSVLSPRLSFLRPAIIGVPLDVTKDSQITLLANMITLTPGTLSLDLSDDKKILYVHCVYVDDPEEKKQELKELFERRIQEVLG
jgi:multicomponent Na+:H+ antiporter subunit E